MGPNYRISFQFNGQDHYVDLRANKAGSVVIGGRSYSVTGDDLGVVQFVLPIIQQNPSSNIEAVATALSSVGQVRTVSSLSDDELSLAARMDAHCKSFERVGFTGAVLVERGDKILLAKAYGPTGVDATTPFYIGSVTKQFTAAAIMQLVDQGIVDLHTSINEYLPDELQSDEWNEVTIEHLLAHTSGIFDFTRERVYEENAPHMRVDIVLQEARTRKKLFLPGQGDQYSNTGYLLLGKIIEYNNKDKMSYNQYVETHILRPAGMHSTKVQEENSMLPYPQACKGHKLSDDRELEEREPFDLHLLYAAGGIISTVQDLALWSHVLSGEMPKVLSKATIERMTRPVHHDVGYGLKNVGHEGRQRICHPGGLAGFSSDFTLYPEERTFMTVLCNSEDFNPEYLTYHLEQIALDTISPAEPLPKEEVSSDSLGFTGTFRSDHSIEPFTFTLNKSGHLQLHREGRIFPAYFLSDGKLVVLSDDPVREFELTPHGTLLVYERGHLMDELKKETWV